MSKIFKSIRVKAPRLNRFHMPFEVKLTARMGELIPIYCKEVLPRDVFKVRTEMLVRAMPLIAPIMHRVNVYCYWFFVPNRLLCKGWEKFITGGDNGVSNGAPPPYFNYAHFTREQAEKFFAKGTLCDYLGYPVPTQAQLDNWPIDVNKQVDNKLTRVSLLPINAYHLIYKEYFRDENVRGQGDVDDERGYHYMGLAPSDVLIANSSFDLRYKKWEKDYFTSALPWPQRGPDVVLPMEGRYPVVVNPDNANPAILRQSSPPHGALTQGTAANNSLYPTTNGFLMSNNKGQAILDPNGSLVVDMDDPVTQGPTIVNLRRASKLQAYYEAKARGGSRYSEYLLSIFGQKSSDARLQRPEYLGGGRFPIMVDDVLQTSASEANGSPQANMAGRGTGVNSMKSFTRRIPEHGFIIGLMSIVPKPTYQNGCDRQLTRLDPLDYYIPQLARIGEQAILNKELYMPFEDITGSGVPTTNDGEGVFGYTPRYAEYKYYQSTVHGDMRDNLSFWHLGRRFSSPPKLNPGFITVFPHDGSRIFATQDTGDDQFVIQIYHDVKALRPMPVYGTPML